jgi:exopolyphosphatase/guanosine-5'-triphosphate,3'-diphosphate pyrophosphatase
VYGIIDIGANTIRLSIYKKTEKSFRLMLTKKSLAGLVGYVDKHGNLSQKGIKKAASTLNVFSQILQDIEVSRIFVFATASLRNIGNSKEALDALKEQSGFDIDLVSGEQEAVYDFIGATHILDLKDGIMIDIGGGSTELVFYKDKQIQTALSMPIGSLSLYTKHVREILPTDDELSEIKDSIKSELKQLRISENAQIICGVGGTVRGALKLNNEIYNFAPDNRVFEVKNLQNMLSRLNEDKPFAVKKIIKIVPDRIHTIIPGMTILESVAKKYSSERIIVSEYGVREGYLYTKLFIEGKENVGEDRML